MIGVVVAMLRDRVPEIRQAGVQALVELAKFGETVCQLMIHKLITYQMTYAQRLPCLM